jgi:hypothetical protein
MAKNPMQFQLPRRRTPSSFFIEVTGKQAWDLTREGLEIKEFVMIKVPDAAKVIHAVTQCTQAIPSFTGGLTN